MFLLGTLLTTLVSAQLIQAGISLTADSDTSGSALGMFNPSPPAKFEFNDRTGLRLEGSYADVLGPPVKIADGFRQLITGSGISGIGSSMQNNGAVLNLDARLLEAAGAGSLIKGGLLLGGSAAKVGAAQMLAGTPGKKIASVVELPVKVVALGDFAAGKTFGELAHKTSQEAQQEQAKGNQLVREGDIMKHNGVQEIMKGASEGVQNFGNMIQKTSNNAASAIRLLPILLDFPKQDQQAPEDGTKSSSQQQTTTSKFGHGHSLGLFGGLGSFLQPPSITTTSSSSGGIFGGANGDAKFGNGLAAVLNATHPLASLATNPSLNPFILPMSAAGASIGGWNPIAQGLGNKQPIGLSGASSMGNGASNGLKLTTTGQMPTGQLIA